MGEYIRGGKSTVLWCDGLKSPKSTARDKRPLDEDFDDEIEGTGAGTGKKPKRKTKQEEMFQALP